MNRLLLALAVCLLLLPARRSAATDLRNVITDMTITSWNEKDGLPNATITALAQDPNGYLWVGTRLGLFRFDGVRFVPWEAVRSGTLPDQSIRSLLVTRGGTMWVGFAADGAIASIVDGRLTASYAAATGLLGGSVLTIAEGPTGEIWAGSDHGLFVFDGSRWSHARDDEGLPDGAVYGIFWDRAGTLYVGHRSGVFIQLQNAGRFERLGDFGDVLGSFAQTRDGQVWVSDPTVGYHSLSDVDSAQHVARQGRGIRLLVDRKGNLWTGTGGQGLWRTRDSSTTASFPERSISLTGLLGDGVYALLEDRDGNIWAGTTEGLNRLTPRTLEQLIDIGLVRGIDKASDGRVWVATVDRLFGYSAGDLARRTELPVRDDVRAVAADRHGMWVVCAGRLFRVAPTGQPSPVHVPAVHHAGTIYGITPDRDGGLWLMTSEDGIIHFSPVHSEPLTLPAHFSESRVTAALVDSARRAWFAFSDGRVASVSIDGTVSLPALPAGQGHVFRTIHEDEGGRIWMGGDGVLTVFDHGRVATLGSSDRFPVVTVTAIATDDRGSLWLGSQIGVVHLAPEEFERAAADRQVVPRYAVYSRSDGVAGTPLAAPFGPGAVRTDDGRIWFMTTRGITVLNPHVLEARNVDVSVRFEDAMADDERLTPGGRLTLPVGTTKLQIDYTVVNLTSPLKPRFRYRLDPFDRDWVDAGSRRQAFYTNLEPGRYVFRVAATAMAGGASSSPEAVWELLVQPRFYQTTAFAVIAGFSVCLMVFGGWQLRERHLRKQFGLLIAERARLGREIHDTLLQGLVALALQFDSLAHELSPMPRLQDRFIRLRDRIEEYIREARRSIWDLHTQPPHRSFVESLRRAGEFATDGREISFVFQVRGTPFQCPPLVEEQAVRIAQEAALNSARHASPTRLRIDLMYEHESLTLKVVDDGRGFDPCEKGDHGHYGIISMQERAKSVGGTLTLVAAPGRGTEITAVLPIAS
jgi:signal transduction histidine kinase/ligand-binding sensor domain-containing protein